VSYDELAKGHPRGEKSARIFICCKHKRKRTRSFAAGDAIGLSQRDVAPGQQLFPFDLEGGRHRPAGHRLGFLQGQLVMPQPVLGPQGVQFVRFRHGSKRGAFPFLLLWLRCAAGFVPLFRPLQREVGLFDLLDPRSVRCPLLVVEMEVHNTLGDIHH